MIKCPICQGENIDSAVNIQPKNRPHTGMYICNDCKKTFLACPYCGEDPKNSMDRKETMAKETFLRCKNCHREFSIGFH